MQPRGRPITLTDDALLDIARDVFLERGLEATTSYIAKRARISESVIFYRYKTKEALFSAVFERQLVMPPGFAKLAWRAGVGEVADNLFDAGTSLVELSERVLPFMMMAFVSPTKLNVLSKHACKPHPMRRELIGLLSGYFEAEIQAGRLRPTRAEILARTFLGGITQFVMSSHLEEPSGDLDAPTFLRGMIDVLLEGSLDDRTPRPRPRPARKRR
ncbi:MAG: Transcriptional regulator, TetR family protein [Myxococcales bacterium]|nr:Transcriptional regulator, TetR family protein [Myxococcales bacterium]